MTPHFLFCLFWLLLNRNHRLVTGRYVPAVYTRLHANIWTGENTVVLMLLCFWSVGRESTNVSWPQRTSLGKQQDSGVGSSGSPWSCPQGLRGALWSEAAGAHIRPAVLKGHQQPETSMAAVHHRDIMAYSNSLCWECIIVWMKGSFWYFFLYYKTDLHSCTSPKWAPFCQRQAQTFILRIVNFVRERPFASKKNKSYF